MLLRSGSAVAVWPRQDGGRGQLRSRLGRGTARAQLIFIFLCAKLRLKSNDWSYFRLAVWLCDVIPRQVLIICSISDYLCNNAGGSVPRAREEDGSGTEPDVSGV